MADSSNYSDGYLQTLVVYRQIAEAAPKFGRLLIHAAVIEYAGKAYAFTAPSGTGKSTHVRLWREVFGDAVTVINGDKPLLRARKPGVARLDCDAAQSGCSDVRASGETVQVIAYGTPWCGKEGWNTNIGAPLAGICLLQQGSKNACVRETPAAALDWMCRQVYMPRDAGAGVLTLELLDALLAEVPLYRLTCDMSRDAVRASFQAMTGLDFDACARRNDGGE